MSLYITGDLRRDEGLKRLSNEYFREGRSMTKADYVLVCGDFGLIWDGSKEEQNWRAWIDSRPWTTIFVDGNHENFDILNKYPVESWNGGKVHRVADSIIHLMRSQVFTIDGYKLFTFGGAQSKSKSIE